jgi:V/A-type H+-transporting ATPase subunit K
MVDAGSLAIIGGAIALVGGVAGSSLGIAIASSAGVAMLSQDRTQLRNVVILAALPMSRVFYAFIVMLIVITTVVPKLEGMSDGGEGLGFAVIGCGIMAALAFAISGAYQGSVCASGISFLSKTKGRILTNSVMLAVFVELLAVLGLVFSIMALSMLGLM